ncbi:MAG: hypothetical protein ABIR27_00050 [Dokdonella sp.]
MISAALGHAPTTSSYTCHPNTSGNDESRSISAPSGNYYVRARAYTTFAGLSLSATITP